MIVRLIGFLVFYGLLLLVPGGIAGYFGLRFLSPTIARWKHRLRGRRNARLMAARDDENCVICLAPCDPDSDPYEPGRGWHHDHCMKALLGP